MDFQEKQLRFKCALSKGLGIRTFLKILEKFGSIAQFAQEGGFRRFTISEEDQKLVSQTNPEQYLVYGEGGYPFLLTQMYDPPIVIHLNGNFKLLHTPMISIVGTRKISPYGERVVTDLVKSCVNAGYTITSGMAFGVDSLAHKVALGTGGNTIAVLGSDPRYPVPSSMSFLHKSIHDNNGLIMADNLDRSPHKSSFVLRNRIIAGLSKVTIVIEAPARSGALITANLAFDYDRDVFVVPGRIYDTNSMGCLNMIKNNKAKIYTEIGDILADLPVVKQLPTNSDLTAHQIKIVEILQCKSADIDQLISETKISTSAILNEMTMLEIQKIVAKNLVGEYTLV